MKYKFTPHITIVTVPFAQKQASKLGLTLEESGPLAIYFIAAANEKTGKGKKLIEELIKIDMQSEAFARFNDDLGECEGFNELTESVAKMIEENSKKGK